MNHKPNHIVLTTIFYPELLHAYHTNISKFGHLDSTCVWVVGDRKTPRGVEGLCKEITGKGLITNYLNCEWQEEWAGRYQDLAARLPWNSETRRNIGYLQALETGCDRLISIDDDNWPTEDDFVGGHLLTGRNWNDEIISEPTGFHNVCEHLDFLPSRAVFPRGYPFKLRGTANDPARVPAAKGALVGVTAGLWLNEPDIDATTWLNGKVNGVGYHGQDAFVLSESTWSPINTQNTSVIRELIPAFLCIPMGWDVPGGKIQRYGDIWGGYFLQAVIGGTRYHAAFGRPLVDHRRNPHNYVDDLRHEFWGAILTDWLLTTLRENFHSKFKDIHDRVIELGKFLQTEALPKMPTWCPAEMREFVKHTGENLVIWAETCKLAVADYK